MPRQLWRAALAAVHGEPRVDGTRVALWGTSLGGGEALITAATDGKTRAVVAQAPQIDSNAEAEATFPGVFWLIRLLFAAWSDLANDALGGAPVRVPATASSDGFGTVVDDAAHAAVKTLAPTGTTYRNEVAARSIPTFDDCNPAVQAAALENATLAEIDGDHCEIYGAPRSEQAATLAADFPSERLQH